MSEKRTERTEKINDGGQAFPQPLSFDAGGIAIAAYPGMSLRDWFAAQAISRAWDVAMEFRNRDEVGPEQACAQQAYAIADAMIAERSK